MEIAMDQIDDFNNREEVISQKPLVSQRSRRGRDCRSGTPSIFSKASVTPPRCPTPTRSQALFGGTPPRESQFSGKRSQESDSKPLVLDTFYANFLQPLVVTPVEPNEL